jgi:hypothetical protein
LPGETTVAQDGAALLHPGGIIISLAGNVGVVSGIPPQKNNRHADM